MKRRPLGRRIAITLVGVSAVLGILAAGAHQAGLVINTTASLPLGVYRTIDAPVARGAYVKFCPPPSVVFDEAVRHGYVHVGFCPGGYAPLLKRVLAVPGDRVQVDDDGVRVEGRLVPLSAPMRADGNGRALPRHVDDRVLTASEVLLMSDVSAVSFDARYFGPIDRRQVQTVIEPLFIGSAMAPP